MPAIKRIRGVGEYGVIIERCRVVAFSTCAAALEDLGQIFTAKIY